MKRKTNLIFDKRFAPTFWTQFWGAFNDNLFKNAMVILIAFKAYTLAGLSPEQMVALSGGIFILPFFLFSATAGQISDKYPKHTLIRYIKIWEILVMIIGAYGFISEQLEVLFISLFFMGLQSTFFGPVKYSILPELINDDELVKANSFIEMGTFLAILLGTILGGVLIALPSYSLQAVSLTTIIIAIIGTISSYQIQKLKAGSPDLKIDWGLIKPTIDIIKISCKEKGVWNSILGISWFWFLGAALLSIFPTYVKNFLGADESVITLFLALFSVGVAVGSLICERLSRHQLELGLVPFGSLGVTLFLVDLSFANVINAELQMPLNITSFFQNFTSYRIVFDLFMLSFFSGIFIVPLYTFIQQKSLPEIRSRIIAGNNILNALFMVISSIFLMGLYALNFKMTTIFLILGILNFIVTTYIYTIIPDFFLRFCVMLIGRIIYKIKTNGLHHIPKDGPALLICNHVSFIDWLIIASEVKRPVRFVMYYKFMQIPFLKLFFKGAKVIPIAGIKEDPQILNDAFNAISEELQEGELVCLFPEGNITKTGELDSFRPGVEKVLKDNPVKVIPMALNGLWGSFFSRKYGKALSRPSLLLKNFRKEIILNISSPIDPHDISLEGLHDKVKKLIK